MIVRRERLKRGAANLVANSNDDPPTLRINIYHNGQPFDVVTLESQPGQPDPRPLWIADYNQMMAPLGLTARLPNT